MSTVIKRFVGINGRTNQSIRQRPDGNYQIYRDLDNGRSRQGAEMGNRIGRPAN